MPAPRSEEKTMELSLSGYFALAMRTLRDPQTVARNLMSMGLPMRARWEALALVLVLTTITSSLLVMIMPPVPDAPAFNPLANIVVQAGAVLIAIYAVHHVGRALGGRGSFGDSLLLMAWLQAVMLWVQLVQVAAQMISPPLAGLVLFLGIGLFIWMLVQFIMVLHGFTSAGKVLVGVMVTMFALGFVIAGVLQALI